MPTLKLTIDRRRVYQDGRCPVIARITNNRKSGSIDLGVKIIPAEWDALKQKITKKNSNYREFNLFLANSIGKLEKNMVEAGEKILEKSAIETKKIL